MHSWKSSDPHMISHKICFAVWQKSWPLSYGFSTGPIWCINHQNESFGFFQPLKCPGFSQPRKVKFSRRTFGTLLKGSQQSLHGDPIQKFANCRCWKSLSILRLTTPEFEGTPGTITPEKPSERVGKDGTVNKLKGERTGVVWFEQFYGVFEQWVFEVGWS